MSGISKRKPLIDRNDPLMVEPLQVGDRVKIYLDSKFWKCEGWYEGSVARIDPYFDHRSFYWVELDDAVQTTQGSSTNLVSEFNPKNIKRTS